MTWITTEMIETQTERDAETGCWVWTGKSDRHGYAMLGSVLLLHRVSYELYNGPIPDGLVIDHVYERGCRSTMCLNPAHLEPVTIAENTARGFSPAAVSHRTNICQSGRHELVGRNEIIGTDGNRQCRECRNEYLRAKRYEANPDTFRYKSGVCRRGHGKTPENTLSNGGCRQCQRDRRRELRLQRKINSAATV